MISAKLPEASFAELMRLLDIFQTNNNIGVEKVLSPFIPRAGERVPLLDEKKKRGTEADIGAISKDMSQDMVQAFQELSNMVSKLKNTPAEDIKKALRGKVYNLQGQYVGSSLQGLSKGVYIINGKKVIIK